MLAVVCPDDHRYVEVPDAISVALDPLHMVDNGVALMLVVGNAFTVIPWVAVDVQPLALVPVTV
jgi:hypothetical protein